MHSNSKFHQLLGLNRPIPSAQSFAMAEQLDSPSPNQTSSTQAVSQKLEPTPPFKPEQSPPSNVASEPSRELSPTPNQSTSPRISPDIISAVDDAQIFVSYIAWDDNIDIDPEVLRALIEAKYLIQEDNWSADAELNFWINFDKLTEQVAPVTIDSLKATLPWLGKDGRAEDKHSIITDAAKAVRRYRRIAYTSLFFLLVFQIYWFIGTDLTNKLDTLFNDRHEVENKIEQMKVIQATNNNPNVTLTGRTQSQLSEDYTILNQELDSNYELLINWNLIWMFANKFEGKTTPYTNFKYREDIISVLDNRFLLAQNATAKQAAASDTTSDEEAPNTPPNSFNSLSSSNRPASPPLSPHTNSSSMGKANYYLDSTSEEIYAWLETQKVDTDEAIQFNDNPEKNFSFLPLSMKKQIQEIYLQKRLDKARNRFFLNRLSAKFVLNALQTYFLPLLYGLLGAVIFVLRTLSAEIKAVTYSADSEIRYRLRMTLGSLAGLIIGWFFQPEEGAAIASLGPMATSFLVGYNVNILFSIMDKFVDSITASIEGQGKTKNTQAQPPAQPPAPVQPTTLVQTPASVQSTPVQPAPPLQVPTSAPPTEPQEEPLPPPIEPPAPPETPKPDNNDEGSPPQENNDEGPPPQEKPPTNIPAPA